MSQFNCFYLILFFNFALCFLKCSALKCKGHNNEDVDWFMVYKLPKLSESDNPLIKRGVAYLYMTSDNPQWIEVTHTNITSKKSIVGYTLDPIYKDKNSSKSLWFLYNDQPPNKSYSARYGHAKGVVMVDRTSGFWLVHSVPNFPPVPFSGETKGQHIEPKESEPSEGRYGYPDSGLPNGQSFLCISMQNTEFDNVGLQLMYNQIIVYRNKIPRTFSTKFANLTAAGKQMRIKKGPMYRLSNITVNGHTFVSFAKSSKWDKELYEDLVAPMLKTDILTETWLNGPDKMPSDCNSTRVYNINGIYFKEINTSFKSSVDHSKWAVANTEEKNWVCIGDINRAKTQFKRGGGTVCYSSLPVWKAYRTLVSEIEPCPRRFVKRNKYSV